MRRHILTNRDTPDTRPNNAGTRETAGGGTGQSDSLCPAVRALSGRPGERPRGWEGTAGPSGPEVAHGTRLPPDTMTQSPPPAPGSAEFTGKRPRGAACPCTRRAGLGGDPRGLCVGNPGRAQGHSRVVLGQFQKRLGRTPCPATSYPLLTFTQVGSLRWTPRWFPEDMVWGDCLEVRWGCDAGVLGGFVPSVIPTGKTREG